MEAVTDKEAEQECPFASDCSVCLSSPQRHVRLDPPSTPTRERGH